jgi:acyl-CoA thioester hydrolase
VEGYGFSRVFATRWNDNDVYGHLNNTIYYAAMDTTINDWLIGVAGLAIDDGEALAVCASSSCTFLASAAYPSALLLGLRAGRVGRTSIGWELGITRESDGMLLATGTFVHVFVDRATRRPTPIPEGIARALDSLS